MPGKTDAEHLRTIAASGVSLVLFLSGGMADAVQTELMQSGAYVPATPAAIVYKATWPDERIIRCTVGTLADAAKSAGIRKHALILVGDFLGASYERSRHYDPSFTTEYRKGAS